MARDNGAMLAHGRRLLRQRRVQHLDKRQRVTSTTANTRTTSADTTVTVTRVRSTATPDDGTDDPTTTAAAPATTRARTPATTAPSVSPPAAAVSSATLPVANTAISPILIASSSAPGGGSLSAANSTPVASTTGGGLSKGATIGIAVAGTLIGLLILGFIGTTLWRRRQSRGQTPDYSWSSREKEDLYGPSPSRNVMSDASFGNTNHNAGAYRPISDESARRQLLGGAPAAGQQGFSSNAAYSENNFSMPKQGGNGYNAPRASFMAGPTGPAPTMGGLYGAAAAGQSPFEDSAQYKGKIYVVRRTFEPSLADELIIYPGDRIEIVAVYDDGWCLGINLDSAKPGQEPQRGVFPRDCVEELNGSQDQPLSNGPAGVQRAPTLPRMSFEGGGGPPAISVSSPEHSEHGHAYKASGASGSGSHILSRFPDTPAHRDSTAVRRTSSLIAGKDAELYAALGEAIDRNGQRHH